MIGIARGHIGGDDIRQGIRNDARAVGKDGIDIGRSSVGQSLTRGTGDAKQQRQHEDTRQPNASLQLG